MKIRFVAVVVMGLVLAMPAYAKGKGNKGGAKGRAGNAVWSERDHDRSVWGFGVRDDRPRGWSQGRKTGWGDCDVPPGQAKKHGCRGWFGTRRGKQRDIYGFGRGERDRGAVIIAAPQPQPEVRRAPRPDGTVSRMPRPPRPTADGRPRPRTQ